MKSDFKTISQKWSPYWDDVSRANLDRYLKGQGHSMTVKQNRVRVFVIWSWILKLFHRNDHHIETTCRMQYLGHYPEGQCHSMTLQQNRVWPTYLLFEVGFKNYFTEMITIWRWCVTLIASFSGVQEEGMCPCCTS